ncbi:DUF2512 family protein [Terrilactibacillus tamarindi]|uniref:DUF2512 family protein n=1 Tax=Terrilactibacillus tamarindi TaxID=2599694 RepID=UPI001E5B5F18|nr:DUF2512 family protein [Terrilactibacillus tamarindi]
MTSFLLKIIACPVAVIISMFLFPGVNYDFIGQAIIVGVVLAIVGVVMEYALLKRGTLWISTAADFIVSVLIVYFLSNMVWGDTVTFFGATLIGLLLGVVEYFSHRYLISTGKTQKSPS